MYGLGIDTGGTFTDAVIYDFGCKKILCASKSSTTKDDLSIGIRSALNKLDTQYFKGIELVSLSTTLATNACVENRGGKAKLIFIGVDKKVAAAVGSEYGLPSTEDIYFLDYKGLHSGEVVAPPDMVKFSHEVRGFLSDADAAAIVDIHAMNNGAVFEKQAHGIVSEFFDGPVICGHELFDDLNSIKRGASALLNARLIPIIGEFLDAIKLSIREYGIDAPVVIVRSDGTLMSDKFTTVRPVETLLCGPCTSVIGGMNLSAETDCLVIDMGGTTTDIAFVTNGIPKKSRDGINIGKWRTYVKGLYIDTFGLGGDSAVRYDKNYEFYLDSARVIPISVLARAYPAITEKLAHLAASERCNIYPIHEFFVLQKSPKHPANLTIAEKKLCELLKNGPLMYAEAAEAVGTDVYRMNFTALEAEGVIIRSGLTPTDIMTLKGDYTEYPSEAAGYAAKYLARCLNLSGETALFDMVYDAVKNRIYTHIMKIIWVENNPHFNKKSMTGDELTKFFDDIWYGRYGFMDVDLNLKLSLVGIGAPIHIFLPDVAKKLRAKCIIPPGAGTANAFGAIMGSISATVSIYIKYIAGGGEGSGFMVYGKDENFFTKDRDAAIQTALEQSQKYARAEAFSRGATTISLTSSIQDQSVPLHGNSEILFGITVTSTAHSSVL